METWKAALCWGLTASRGTDLMDLFKGIVQSKTTKTTCQLVISAQVTVQGFHRETGRDHWCTWDWFWSQDLFLRVSATSRTGRHFCSVLSRSRTGPTGDFWSRLTVRQHCNNNGKEKKMFFFILWSKIVWKWFKTVGKAAKCYRKLLKDTLLKRNVCCSINV